MVHCGYEPTAVMDTVRHPVKALLRAVRGIETEAPMAPEIPLDAQRPAEYVFEAMVADLSNPESERREQSDAA